MSVEMTIIAALLLPVAGAFLISLAGRINANLRETVTLVTAVGLAATVWSLIPLVMDGGRPGVTITELLARRGNCVPR